MSGGSGSSRGSPAVRAGWIAVFVLALSCAMAWRPVLYGEEPLDVARYLVFLAGWIVLPGCLVQRMIRPAGGDRLLDLGMGWMLGLALQAVVFVALRIGGAPALFAYYPIAVLLAYAAHHAMLLRSRAGPEREDSSSIGVPPVTLAQVASLFVLCVIAVQRSKMFAVSGWWSDLDADFSFHAANAAEFANHWPMRNPRVASVGLNYHFFSYALPAGASEVMGLSIRDTMLRLAVSTTPVLLALQVFNAGRIFGGSAVAGLVAAALLVLRADLGLELARWIGASGVKANFGSYLGIGVFTSPTTSSGLVYFVTIAIVLRRVLDPERAVRRADLAILALAALCASGSKGSVMPVVIIGLAMLLAFELVARRRLEKRTTLAIAVLAAASLPMTLFLSIGDQSYGSAMVRFLPGTLMRLSGFFAWVATSLGIAPDRAPASFEVLIAPLWVVGYFGLVGVTAAIYSWKRRTLLDSAERWLVACAVFGLAFVLLFAAPGQSELFFLYTGEVGLFLLAAAALAAGWIPRGVRASVVVIFGVPFVAAGLLAVRAEVARDREPKDKSTALTAQYSSGLEWIRANTPRDAVLVTNHDAMLASVHGERATFYETEAFMPQSHARSWKLEAGRWTWRPDGAPLYPALDVARRQFFAQPSRETVKQIRATLPAETELYAVFDGVVPHGRGTNATSFAVSRVPPLPRPVKPALMSLVFENEAMRIYRIEAGRGP